MVKKKDMNNGPGGDTGRFNVDRDADSSELKSNIDRTRDEMDATLDELSHRLSPRNLLHELTDMFRGKSKDGMADLRVGAKAAGKTLGRQIRRHPVPAALITAGVVWQLWESAHDEDEGRWPSDMQHEPGMADQAKAKMSKAGDKISAGAQKAKGAFSSAASRVGDKMSHAADTVGEKASHVGEHLSEMGHQMQHQGKKMGRHIQHGASSAADSIQHGAASAAQSVQQGLSNAACAVKDGAVRSGRAVADTAHHHPLAVGLGCLAAGLVGGLLSPRTKAEDEWMGEASDDLKHKAADMGEEIVERGRDVVDKAASTAMDEAEKQGLTPSQFAHKAQHVAKDAADAAEKAAKDEGLTPQQLRDKVETAAENTAEKTKDEAKRQGKEMKQEHSSSK